MPRSPSRPAAGPPPGGGGPRGFQLGWVLPPHVRNQVELTKDQEKEIAELEKLVKEKLDKILTDEQKKKIAGGGGPGGGQPQPKDPPKKEEKPKEEKKAASGGGIQWFTTLEAGRAEAEKTGRPILFISGTPHCSGVSGIW